MNQLKQLASGCMPNTDFQYEELEGLLASYYLTYQHFLSSQNENAVSAFRAFLGVLNSIAKRHNIQGPEEAIKNIRTNLEWARPKKLTYFSVKDLIGSFYRDFGIVRNPGDGEDVFLLYAIVHTPTFAFE